MEKKKIDWKNVGWRTLQFLIILILNAPTILLVLCKIIEVDTLHFGSVSLWNALTIKVFGYSGYHWYNDFIIYIFIIIGIILTIMFIKFLYKNNKDKKKEKKEDEKTEMWNKTFEKIFGKEKE